MENTALIFIPDISGYTEFVTQTEIKHSNHIISELLEVILNANQIKLEVSEIEGDAVLFYRKGDPPKLEELISQVKRMFIDFHTHLKIIQRDNVCQCGACRTATNLSLKFIAHYGVLQETVIQNFVKIMGSDVILAHRLLKNTIDEKEYMLATDYYLSTQDNNSGTLENWVNFLEKSESFNNFPEIKIQYTSLLKVLEEIPAVPQIQKIELQKSKPDATITIDAPILLVHEMLTDSEAKLHIAPGIKDVKSNSPINRINATHTCIFEDLEVHFVTQLNQARNGEINYLEEVEVSLGFGFISDYTLKENNGGTILSVRTFPKIIQNQNETGIKKIWNKIKTNIIHSKIKSTSKKNLVLYKNYCEKVAQERISSEAKEMS
jgi:hypothetical protein